jgi:glyoxylase-like metal-dependent hydrolase (beta-lactamase superfamily II)
MKYKKYNLLPSFDTNTYLVWDEDSMEAMLIDVAAPSKEIINEIKSLNLKLKFLINTHGHGDHIGGNKSIKENFDIQLLIHEDDAETITDPHKNLSTFWGDGIISPSADIKLKGGEKFKLGNKELTIIHTPGHSEGGISILIKNLLTIIHTPGHSEGGISILIKNLLFSGDTLFAGAIGRDDIPGGDYNTLVKSIQEKLFKLPDDTIVLPGHGPYTTIGREKRRNPYVGLPY